jgi:hypothetical protein
MSTTNEDLLKAIMSKVSSLDIVSGQFGTVKLHGTGTIETQFRGICFSEATTVSTFNDTQGGNKDTYFTDTTYTVNAGDIIVAHGANSGNRINAIRMDSGSAIGIL